MLRIIRLRWVAGACTIALLALGAGGAQAQFSIDHYLVYENVIPTPGVVQVNLQDQFGDSQVILDFRDRFANPVAKEYPEIPDPLDILYPDEHLSWWWFEQPYPHSGYVQVGNQFGLNQTWLLGDAEYLLVPAIKDGEGEITLNQHYLCYVALEAPDIQVEVNLADQFGLYLDVPVLAGRYLCNPVEKFGPPPLEPSGPPIFPQDHLACYQIGPSAVGQPVTVEDQVTFDPAELGEADMLCVPSSKSQPSAVPSLRSAGIVALGLSMLLTVFWLARQRLRHGAPA